MRLQELKLPHDIKGHLFLGSLPGLRYAENRSNFYHDEKRIMELGITTVVRLSPTKDVSIDSPPYSKHITEKTLKWKEIYHPVEDYSAPDDVVTYHELVNEILNKLRNGESILVHCGGGIGRTGTFGMALLYKLGYSYDDAFCIVDDTGSRPENEQQDLFLAEFKVKA
jgi:protein-tyrosine phosphatase